VLWQTGPEGLRTRVRPRGRELVVLLRRQLRSQGPLSERGQLRQRDHLRVRLDNLVFELGLVLLILLGWQFVAAEFAGGLLMAVLIWIFFKVTCASGC